MNFKLCPSPKNPNTREAAEEGFIVGGVWEKNRGRYQTAKFAKCFLKHIRVPFRGRFTILDVGCALGDALPEWRRKYPEAVCYGADISQNAVDRARKHYGDIATFFRASFDEITGNYNVIYCSNAIEHFEEYLEIAEKLLQHCDILYILTPYAELDGGRPLSLSLIKNCHVATFYADSFQPLVDKGIATVEWKVIRCPVAWSPSLLSEAWWHVRYMLGMITDPSPPARQVIYTLRRIVPIGG